MSEIGRNINAAYRKGHAAHLDGTHFRTGNPYKLGSPSWKAWRAGWLEAASPINAYRRRFAQVGA